VLAAAIKPERQDRDKNAVIKALARVRVDTLLRTIKFDEYGNVVGNIYIRKGREEGRRLVNTNIQTYRSQSSSGPTIRRVLNSRTTSRYFGD